MKLKEENDLHTITDRFTEAIQQFQKKDYKKSRQLFEKIIEEFKDSEFYSVLEIETRAKVYLNIIDSQENRVQINLEGFEDHLWQGVYLLNGADHAGALETLNKADSLKSGDPFVHFLLAVAHHKNEEPEKALQYIQSSIAKDPFYKVIIYNEPDFESLRESEEFLALVQ